MSLGRPARRARLRHKPAQIIVSGRCRHVVTRREGAEDAGLVGRLVGARAPQAVGPVGADDDDAAPRVVRLHDGGQQVADGRARRRDDRDRTSRAGGEPESEEARGPLVDADVQAQVTVAVGGVESEGERSRP